MTNAVKQRLSQLRALLDILDQRREKANGEHTADLQEKIYAIDWPSLTTKQHSKLRAASLAFRSGRAAMPDRNFNWQTLCEAAILETNPDKLAICIGAAEHAIAQRESLVDTELERHKLADARSMLKTLSRISMP